VEEHAKQHDRWWWARKGISSKVTMFEKFAGTRNEMSP
jgi:hypothetical protein